MTQVPERVESPGAGARQQINLIDPSLLAPPARPSLAALAGLVIAAALGVGLHYTWERSAYQRAIAQSRTDAAAVPVEEAKDADSGFEARLAKVEQDEALLAGLQRATELPAGSASLLGALGRALPESLWLKEIEIKGSRDLRIVGGALDVGALALYVNRLSEVARLGGLPIQLLEIEPREADTEAEPGSNDVKRRMPAHHRFVLASDSDDAKERP